MRLFPPFLWSETYSVQNLRVFLTKNINILYVRGILKGKNVRFDEFLASKIAKSFPMIIFD